MNKDNMYILISYASVKGGTNNLQIANIVRPSPHGGMVDIIKTFSSLKMRSLVNAQKWLENNK